MNASKGWLAIVLAVGSAASFAISVGGGRWWVVGDTFQFGPLGARQCVDGDCRATGFMLDAGPRLERAATATAAAGFIATLVLLAFAAALAAGRTPVLLGRMTLAALATAMFAGGAFAVLLPSMPGTSADRGAFLFLAALALGACAWATAKLSRSSVPAK